MGAEKRRDQEGRVVILLISTRLRSKRDPFFLLEEKNRVNLPKNNKFTTKTVSKRKETKPQIQV